MLDYVLVFSLEKLVFDNGYCGQALHFVRDFKADEDLPTVDLVASFCGITPAHPPSHPENIGRRKCIYPAPPSTGSTATTGRKPPAALHQRILAKC